MSESLMWGLVALSALFLCLMYGLLIFYFKLKQREMLQRERLSAIAGGQSPPGDAKEIGWRASFLLRLASAPGMKIASFVEVVFLSSGVGVWAGFGLLPDCYVLHDFWSLGLIGAALGLGFIVYALCSKGLTKTVIAERKLS